MKPYMETVIHIYEDTHYRYSVGPNPDAPDISKRVAYEEWDNEKGWVCKAEFTCQNEAATLIGKALQSNPTPEEV